MPASTRPPRRAPERGTVLVLVPAMTLVVLSLGAIAVDLSLVHSVHRDAHRVAASAADDAAGMIDERTLQVSGRIELDPARAERVARAHVAAADLAGDLVDVQVDAGPATVDVVLTVDAPHVILPALPGGERTSRLRVAARGRLHR